MASSAVEEELPFRTAVLIARRTDCPTENMAARRPLEQRLRSLRELRKSWDRINTAHPDSLEVQHFALAAHHNLRHLAHALGEGTFSFSGFKGRILRQGKKRRGIMEPPIRDKIVQTTLLRLIYPSFRRIIVNPVSFGSIKNKKINDAARAIVEYHRQGYTWVFETDIKKFFDRIDRKVLLDLILGRLYDSTLNVLIAAATNAELENKDILMGNEDLFPGAGIGIPQGSVLSPIFANLYLAPFDVEMIRRGFKMVRYVDDLVIMCKTKEEAKLAYDTTLQLLADIRLEIHGLNEKNENGKIKTKITAYADTFDFLGIRFEQNRLQPSTDKIERFLDKLKDLTDLELERDETILDRLNRLNRVIKGWGNAYRFCNAKPIYLPIDVKIRQRVAFFLQRHGLRPVGEFTETKIRNLGIRRLADIKLDPIHHASEKIAERIAA